ncbi:MAG TPA: response regulator [Steroidobacteraceae bacterium]|nr:response regulator [Steroidobacteraceae bacterium]
MPSRPTGTPPTSKRIFQIAYDDQSEMYLRASLLRERGYEVQSVLGNQAAKDVLVSWPRYDLFIIGHNAPEATRVEMVQFIRANYPRQPIIALNAAAGMQLCNLPYNAPVDEPGIWIPLVQQAESAEL